MNLVYGVKDRPKFGQMLIFAFQQLLAILAATIAVPSIVGNGMSQSAALFGAGVGTLVYLCFSCLIFRLILKIQPQHFLGIFLSEFVHTSETLAAPRLHCKMFTLFDIYPP